MSRTRQGDDQANPESQSHGDSSDRGQSSRKWTKETIVGVMSLGVAVIVVFFGDGWLRGDDGPPPVSSATGPVPAPTATASSTSAISSTPASSRSPSPDPTTAPSVRWTGVVRLGAGVDLDKIPPTIRTSQTRADIWESSSFFVSSIEAQAQSLAPWNDSAAPTRQQCIETLSTQGTTEWGESGGEEVATGDIFCIRTSEGRVAAIKMKDAPYHNMQVTAKVWDAIDSF